MATDKTFSVVGVSSLNGAYKVRFANDIMRIKVLAKHGHTDIRLADLGAETGKYAAVELLKSMDEFQDVAAQDAIAEYLSENAPKADKPAKVPVVKVAVVKPTKLAKPAKVAVVKPAKVAVVKPAKATMATREAEALTQARAAVKAEKEAAKSASNVNSTVLNDGMFNALISRPGKAITSKVVNDEDAPF
jgi:hypothetical protein